MAGAEAWVDHAARGGLLVDTNLLVLYVVGTVNRRRIQDFKRTSKYSVEDYDLLIRVLGAYTIYTVAHIMAEVSNLTDLGGAERRQAREVLKATIKELCEPHVPSVLAVGCGSYGHLGLVDAAIIMAAREQHCAVITDDLDLYCALSAANLPVLNFTHLRAREWRI